jgi:predicted ABC-type ATPase
MNNEDIKKQAEEFAKINKKRIAKDLTNISKYPADINPISIFMAGSPGAGKTEYSKNFLLGFNVVRIDGDELRSYLPGYTGKNSYLFQGAISIIVEKIHDLVLENNQTFLLDGTLSKYEKAHHNINRSLNKNRKVYIFYLYQDHKIAWEFTKQREVVEGRNIPKDVFIEQFLETQNTLDRIRKEFGSKIVVFLLKNNFKNDQVEKSIHVDEVGLDIADYIGIRYSKDELEKLLC